MIGFAGFAAAACLVLSACSGSPTAPSATSAPAAASASAPASPSATPSEQAASSGRSIAGKGYRYTVPKGWGEPKTDVGQSAADSLAADLEDKDGFADNVNVVVVDAGSVTSEQIESQGPQQLKTAGFSKVALEDRVKVAGVESPHITALQKSGTYRIDQFYVLRKGKGYIVTFSFSPKVSKADREAVTTPTLGSWNWS
jgi:hypothetical protein